MSEATTKKTVRIRASEAAKKTSLTFADLCDLVDQGREAGVNPSAVVLGDTWVARGRGEDKGRDGYLVKYIEI